MGKNNVKLNLQKITYFLAFVGQHFFLSPVGHSFALKKWDVLIALLPVLWPKFRPLATLFAQFVKASFHLPLLHSSPKEQICSTKVHLVLVVFVGDNHFHGIF
jgi:hypothetical protein